VLGLSNIVFLLAAVPMAIRLWRQRRVLLPPGFGLWLLFLAWVVLGVLVVSANAPHAVIGDTTFGRYLTFGWRLAVYVAMTVVLLYVANIGRRELPVLVVTRLLGLMFVITTVGGLVGAVLPPMEFRSALEYVLPHGLVTNGFVQSLVHPHTADVQSVLGYAEARPVAPFDYANSWGANYSLFLPFFLLSWFGKDAGWRRFAAPVVLAVSLVPVVYSLNRGRWIALGVGLVYVAVRLAAMGRLWALQALIGGLVVTTTLVLASPLNAVIQERLAHPHSNDRRGELLSLTFTSAATGSPVIGFGTTRNVQGSFASIAGGSSPDCPGCGVPPLGTQGTFWSVVFFQGVIGLALFLLFFALWFRRHRRDTSPVALAGTAVVLMAAVEMFVYDFGACAFFTIMIAVGLVWREHGSAGTGTS
jgi:hypothetical protein